MTGIVIFCALAAIGEEIAFDLQDSYGADDDRVLCAGDIESANPVRP